MASKDISMDQRQYCRPQMHDGGDSGRRNMEGSH